MLNILRFGLGVKTMVLNATFNNISAISWRPVLLMEETEIPGDKNRPVARDRYNLSHNAVSSTSRLCGVPGPDLTSIDIY